MADVVRLGVFLVAEGAFPSANITMGVAYPCNWFVLNKLVTGQPCSCPELAYASENTCVLYSIFEDVREALIGTPVARHKYKVSTVACNYQNGEFLISINCPNNFAVVESIMTEVAHKLVPRSTYNRYAYNIRLLNGVPINEEFLYICNKMAGAAINFVVGGSLNASRDVINELLTQLFKLMGDPSPLVGGAPPQSLAKKQGVTEYPVVAAAGYKAFYVDAFIRHATGVSTAIHSGGVIIYDKEWGKTAASLTARMIDGYVAEAYSAGEDYNTAVTLFAASIECSLDTASLRGAWEGAPTPPMIGGYIKDALAIKR